MTRVIVTGSAVTSSTAGSRYVRPITGAESKIRTSGASATHAATSSACRVTLWPEAGSLIATTSAAAERSVLPSAPQRGSSTKARAGRSWPAAGRAGSRSVFADQVGASCRSKLHGRTIRTLAAMPVHPQNRRRERADSEGGAGGGARGAGARRRAGACCHRRLRRAHRAAGRAGHQEPEGAQGAPRPPEGHDPRRDGDLGPVIRRRNLRRAGGRDRGLRGARCDRDRDGHDRRRPP